MKSLAVRVSAVKNSDNQKKSLGELRILVLKLPKTQTFEYEPSDADAIECWKSFKKEFSAATGADQQLVMVNSLIRHFTREEQWVLSDELLCQMLSDLHFHAPLKHPVRNAVVKVLQKEAIRKRNIVFQSLLRSVSESNEGLRQMLDQNDIDTEALKEFVTSLSGYFDNFNEGVSSLEPYFFTLLETLHRFIGVYMQILDSNSLSSAKRSAFYIDLHNVLRVVLSCVQQYQSQITDPSMLQPILTQCWIDLLDTPIYSDLPMDTKINCGILRVFRDRYFEDVFAPREKILTQFGGESVLSKGLCYGIAIINTITEKDFADSNFYVALHAIVDRLIEVGKEYTMDSCIVMAVTRALVQYSKKVLTYVRKIAPAIPADDIHYVRLASQNCLKYVWLNVHHSIDCVRYLTFELLKNLLRLDYENSESFILLKSSNALEKSSEIKEHTIDQLSAIIQQLEDSDEIDEINNPMWKFINAHLIHHPSDVLKLDDARLSLILESIRKNTQPHKSAYLRQTATETLSIVSSHFTQPNVNLEFLVCYADLLLALLRDDNVGIRNRSAEIVMDLVQTGSTKQVIPLAAEDHFLDWLDAKFVSTAKGCEIWTIWLKLLRLMQGDESVNGQEPEANDDNLIEVDIFEADEQNTFDEAVYTQYKCYRRLISHVSGKAAQVQNEIKIEFPTLNCFLD